MKSLFNITAPYFTLCLVFPCLVGCDIDPLGEKADARRHEAKEREERELVRKETEQQRDAMSKYAVGKKKNVSARIEALKKEETELRSDAARLTSEMEKFREAKDSKGNDLKYESKLLRTLKAPIINELATKHLATDFSADTGTYIERVREAREAEAQYTAAKREVDEMYKANIEETKKWAAMTTQQRASEIARLNKELTQLERRRESIIMEQRTTTKHSILNGPRGEAERYEKAYTQNLKLQDIDTQIRTKRGQLDVLTSPKTQQSLADRTTYDAQWHQSRANSARESAMYDIDKRLKPKKSVLDVVVEFEEATIGKLRKTLTEKISKVEGESKSQRDKLAAIEDAILQIPVSDLADLKRIMTVLDR